MAIDPWDDENFDQPDPGEAAQGGGEGSPPPPLPQPVVGDDNGNTEDHVPVSAGGSADAGNGENTPEPEREPWDPAAPEEREPADYKYNVPNKTGLTWQMVGAALKEAKGNRHVAAAALGTTKHDVDKFIQRNATLTALFAREEAASVKTIDAALRGEKDNPVESSMTPEEQVEMIQKQDREIQLKGLKGLGVNDRTIEKLRSLDGLAKTAEKFLSVSVVTCYQMFAISQIHLFEQAEDIRAEITNNKNLNPKDKAMLQKLYLEFTRETNRGTLIQFDAAAKIVAMMQAARGNAAGISPVGGKKPKKLKPGFTEIVATPQ